MKVFITNDQQNLILKLIKKYFPNAHITAFGSRVRGDHKTYSDLDLSLNDNGVPLSLASLALLEEELSLSDIPFKIDIVDYNRVTKDFSKLVDSTGIHLSKM